MCLAVAEVMLSSGRQDADSALAFYATGAIRGTQVVLSGSTCLQIALCDWRVSITQLQILTAAKRE